MKFIPIALVFLTATFALKSACAQEYNRKLAAQLASIYKSDQQYRVAAIAAAKKSGAGSKQDNDLMHKQNALDLSNLAKIDKIINTYGYPGKSMVGAQTKVPFMVVQHNDLDAQEKYLPIFTKAAERGELDRSLLPLMIDRVRTAKGQTQLYGTQLSEIKGGGIQIFPIEDEINVDIRRKAAGLTPLQNYYKAWGIHYLLPTAEGNLNPKELYVNLKAREEMHVEAIGGDEGIYTRLRYPEKAKSAGITGHVTVQFAVDTAGNTYDVSVVKELGYGCDEEAMRVIKETKYTNKSGEGHELRMNLPFPYKKQ